LSQIPPGCRLVDLKASRMLSALPKLATWLRRRRPTALLAAMDHANLVAIWARQLARVQPSVRLAVSVRSQLSVAAANEPSLRGRTLPWLARQFYPWADSVIAVSEGVADDLVSCLGLSRAQIAVIPNPVVSDDIEALANAAGASLVRAWRAAGAARGGTTHHAKGISDAAAGLRPPGTRRDLRLMILGEGPDRAALQAEIDALGLGARVALPGFDPNPFRYLARARLFVLSSAWEGLPGVLIQAMACGTPVVSTDCPSGPREVLAEWSPWPAGAGR
jgi:glycosyltransferase involved in cell wall biosynthesis